LQSRDKFWNHHFSDNLLQLFQAVTYGGRKREI